MPTRPIRRERRRADRRNAKKITPFSPESAPSLVAVSDLVATYLFINAVPIVRLVMRIVLIQKSFTRQQVVVLIVWKKELEEVLKDMKPQLSASGCTELEHQIMCFNDVIELHTKHFHELNALQLRYAKQVIM